MIIGLKVFLLVFVGHHGQPHLSHYDRDRSITETNLILAFTTAPAPIAVALIKWPVETSAPTQGNGDSYSQ